jgi:hypothetical protein
MRQNEINSSGLPLTNTPSIFEAVPLIKNQHNP